MTPIGNWSDVGGDSGDCGSEQPNAGDRLKISVRKRVAEFRPAIRDQIAIEKPHLVANKKAWRVARDQT